MMLITGGDTSKLNLKNKSVAEQQHMQQWQSQKQSTDLMNMRGIVANFRQKRAAIVARLRPRPAVLFQAMHDACPATPMPLLSAHIELLDGAHDYQ